MVSGKTYCACKSNHIDMYDRFNEYQCTSCTDLVIHPTLYTGEEKIVIDLTLAVSIPLHQGNLN